MGKPFRPAENKLVNELMADIVTYRLTQSEGMKYIEMRFRPISDTVYKRRHALINSDKTVNLWLSYFTRIGFVLHHKKLIEDAMRIQNDSLREFITETSRPTTPPRDNPTVQLRDQDYVLKLKNDIRENIRLLTDLGLGTPIISALKAKLDKVESKLGEKGNATATGIQGNSELSGIGR